MGQKVAPTAFRTGIIRGWQSRWFSDKDYATYLHEDLAIRQFFSEHMAREGISKILIERKTPQKITLHIYTARPGVLIGKAGSKIENIKKELEKKFKKNILINILAIEKPDLDARLVGEAIAIQIEKRIHFRKAIKQTIQRVIKAGGKGVRVQMSGRLGGAEIARREWERVGRIPLHTIRADIDFARVTAHTTYGCIGIKVWIFKDEVVVKDRLIQTNAV